MKKRKQPNGLTDQQQKLVKAVKANPAATLRELAEASGYSEPAAVHRALEQPAVAQHLLEFYKTLEAAGATDKKAARVIAEGMDAVSYTMTGRPYPAHKQRLEAAKLYVKIKRLANTDEEDDDPARAAKPVMIFMNGGQIVV